MIGAILATSVLAIAGGVTTVVMLARYARHEFEAARARDTARPRDPGEPERPLAWTTDEQIVIWAYALGYSDLVGGVPDPGALEARVSHIFGPGWERTSAHQHVVASTAYIWGRTDAADGRAQKPADEVWRLWQVGKS